MIILPQRQCQALSGYVVLKEAVPLDTEVFYLFVHPLESVLGRPNSQFVIYDFLNQILLQDGLKFLTGVLLGQFPLPESPMQGMIHRIDSVACPLLAKFPLLDPPAPLVEGLGDDFEVGVSEKEAHDRTMHLTFLLLTLFREVLRDILLRVALSTQEILKCLNVTAHFIPF